MQILYFSCHFPQYKEPQLWLVLSEDLITANIVDTVKARVGDLMSMLLKIFLFLKIFLKLKNAHLRELENIVQKIMFNAFSLILSTYIFCFLDFWVNCENAVQRKLSSCNLFSNWTI